MILTSANDLEKSVSLALFLFLSPLLTEAMAVLNIRLTRLFYTYGQTNCTPHRS